MNRQLEKWLRSDDFVKMNQSEDGLAWVITLKSKRKDGIWQDMYGGYRAEDQYEVYLYKGNHKAPVLTDPRVDYLKPEEFDLKLPNCYIVDIDGTIALINGRSPYNGSKAHTDVENFPVTNILRLFHSDSIKNHIIYSTGRDEQYREDTENWLKDKGIFYGGSEMLLMRPSNEKKPDSHVKMDNYYKHIHGKYNVELVLEDRSRVSKMYRDELKLPTLEPWYSNF